MNSLLRILEQMPAREIEILACLVHELTVQARGGYPSADKEWPMTSLELLRGTNEVIHRISAQLRSISSTGERAFSRESFGRDIFEHAVTWGVGEQLEKAASLVSRRLGP
jgi:hypothetical protein